MTINQFLRKKMSHELPNKIDYMLVCAGFESRSLSMYDFFNASDVKSTATFFTKQFHSSAKGNIEKYKAKFNGNFYEIDNSDPTSIADALVDFFSNITESTPVILVDISTFTREAMLIILKFLEYSNFDISETYFYYRKAKVSDKLSEQVIQVRSVLGYMGNLKLNTPLHLIILSGFEIDRAREIIEILEPDYISIGFGSKSESISEDLFKRNLEFTNQLVAYYTSENIFKFNHSLIDPIVTKNQLEKVVSRVKNHNVVIAPLNNKISTIGAGLLGISNVNIQLCYSQMASYNETSYSEPIDDCIIFKPNFFIDSQP